jgi:tripartite ATP-independent transporter DctM subunit
MEWWLLLIIILGSLVFLMLTGMPTAYCFLTVIMVGVFLLWRGTTGLNILVLSIRTSVANFALIPLILFMMMGGVLFDSGIAPVMIEALNKWLGRLPGRLGLLTILSGTIFATLSGSSMASVAMLGSTIAPQMERHGYKKPMSLGTIMGCGGLAMLIPPSNLAIVIAVLGDMSVGRLLIAMIVPGFLMALVIAIYIIVRCWLQPDLAPNYDVGSYTLAEKLKEFSIYVLPMAIIVFLVTGIIFLGVATPSESAACGCLGCFVLAACYKKLSWKVTKIATESSLRTTVMLLLIMASAAAYTQIIVFTKANAGMFQFLLNSNFSPVLIIAGVEVVVAVMGCFMPVGGILMIVMPLFTPVVEGLGLDPIWFGIITLINCEMADLTPPFGMILFTMKAVAPRDTTMRDIYLAALPFVGIDILVIASLFVFPELTTWLPSFMK